MAREQAIIDRDELSIYEQLKRDVVNIDSQTQVWMNTATTLHTASTAEEKAEVIALRTDFIAKLKVTFGI